MSLWRFRRFEHDWLPFAPVPPGVRIIVPDDAVYVVLGAHVVNHATIARHLFPVMFPQYKPPRLVERNVLLNVGSRQAQASLYGPIALQKGLYKVGLRPSDSGSVGEVSTQALLRASFVRRLPKKRILEREDEKV